jgi:predicted DNA-binding transcriptional regulator AlpA
MQLAKEQPTSRPNVNIIRHKAVCQKLQVSSAKLFDMVARGQLFKPFALVPGGRAVGWLEEDIDQWILERKAALTQGSTK